MRLIDADELKKDLICFYPEGVPMGLSPETLFKQILHDIDNAPTVDAVINTIEVRPQGEWLEMKRKIDNRHSVFIFKCPFCGYIEKCKTNFCPNCGADMRGKEKC